MFKFGTLVYIGIVALSAQANAVETTTYNPEEFCKRFTEQSKFMACITEVKAARGANAEVCRDAQKNFEDRSGITGMIFPYPNPICPPVNNKPNSKLDIILLTSTNNIKVGISKSARSRCAESINACRRVRSCSNPTNSRCS